VGSIGGRRWNRSGPRGAGSRPAGVRNEGQQSAFHGVGSDRNGSRPGNRLHEDASVGSRRLGRAARRRAHRGGHAERCPPRAEGIPVLHHRVGGPGGARRDRDPARQHCHCGGTRTQYGARHLRGPGGGDCCRRAHREPAVARGTHLMSFCVLLRRRRVSVRLRDLRRGCCPGT
jgi:hypothetical protein